MIFINLIFKPYIADIYAYTGKVNLVRRNFDKAIQSYKKAIYYSSHIDFYRVQLGVIYEQKLNFVISRKEFIDLLIELKKEYETYVNILKSIF